MTLCKMYTHPTSQEEPPQSQKEPPQSREEPQKDSPLFQEGPLQAREDPSSSPVTVSLSSLKDDVSPLYKQHG